MKSKMRSEKRSYDQWCAVARSLDIVGERWTMLIVRDLLIGPKRYKDLLAGLPGIGTNLLARRLRELEARGLIQRTDLPAPASATVYGLTEKGAALEPVVSALGRWGFEFLGKPRPSDAMLPAPFFVSLHASFNPTADPALDERYAFLIDDRIFEVDVAKGRCAIREGGVASPDVTFWTDAATLFALRRRELTPKQAIASGKVQVDGDPKALERFVSAFAWSKEQLARTTART
jgi:DNA-binding HxlR family transcriptional regulator/putative sterol carrier protein